MIFPKKYLNLEFPNSNFFTSNFSGYAITVNSRKYEINKIQKEIIIVRKINDIFDLMGFVPLKRCVVAKGNVEFIENLTKLKLEIKIESIYEIFLLFFFSLYGLMCLYVLSTDLSFGFIFLFMLTVMGIFAYFLFMKGLNDFKSDLVNDINYFK